VAIALSLWCEKCPGVTSDKSMVAVLDYSLVNIQKENVKGKFLTLQRKYQSRVYAFRHGWICGTGVNKKSCFFSETAFFVFTFYTLLSVSNKTQFF